jgi:HAD superfamily hydrolase (TIGR01662 family)
MVFMPVGTPPAPRAARPRTGSARRIDAVFFDVDFTLIHPGPAFDGRGYRAFAARHGLRVDASCFDEAVREASVELERLQDGVYRPEPFVRYVSRVLKRMGAVGDGIEACSLEIYDEWALCHHFALYDDASPTLAALHAAGYRIGLISNTHRCLDAFQSHFALQPFITAAVSSFEHGYLKPHPSIFRAALERVGTCPEGGVMVGDSLTHDIAGARRVGMAAVLLVRSGDAPETTDGVPVIRSLAELPGLLAGDCDWDESPV